MIADALPKLTDYEGLRAGAQRLFLVAAQLQSSLGGHSSNLPTEEELELMIAGIAKVQREADELILALGETRS